MITWKEAKERLWANLRSFRPLIEWEVGQGGQNLPPPVSCSPASRIFNSRFPPFSVLLPTPVNWQSRIIIIIFI